MRKKWEKVFITLMCKSKMSKNLPYKVKNALYLHVHPYEKRSGAMRPHSVQEFVRVNSFYTSAKSVKNQDTITESHESN